MGGERVMVAMFRGGQHGQRRHRVWAGDVGAAGNELEGGVDVAEDELEGGEDEAEDELEGGEDVAEDELEGGEDEASEKRFPDGAALHDGGHVGGRRVSRSVHVGQ
jgi:hypothetical protein